MTPDTREDWLRTLRLLGLVALAGFVVRAFVVGAFAIPSGSMLPQLRPGDYLLVAKWPYGWSRYGLTGGWRLFDGRLWSTLPRRGDVVVIRDGDRNVVKRVIGLPGDRIALRGGTVLLDGTAVARWRIGDIVLPQRAGTDCHGIARDQAGCRYRRYHEMLPQGRSYAVLDTGPTLLDRMAERTVPRDHVFLIGDNRDDSADSRVARADGGLGMVPTDRLLGRALVLFWSTDGTARLPDPASWRATVRWARIGLSVE